ncbi:MAG TPA: 4a-hydroxytetrahydrobiopterin dehydratase [Candidatus Limnocylindria bacterium]|nr:4a-hydroxytetrahydrobiopterin dehydratase [Candidatus Limnocylindria bacterium]
MASDPNGQSAITPEAAYQALRGHSGWVVERARLYRDFDFDSFVSAIAFVNQVAELAERLGHHPNIRIHEWRFVQLELYSHLLNALTRLDVEFALALDAMLGGGKDSRPI